MLATKKPKKNVEINYTNSYGIESLGRHLGPVTKIQRNPFNPRFFMSVGDWTVGLVGRNLKTFTSYSGLDPETGATGGNNQSGSGLINQVDAFGFPTLRTFTLSLSTRF